MQQPGLFSSSPTAQAPVARATVEDAALLAAVGAVLGAVVVFAAAAWAVGAPVGPAVMAWLKAGAWLISGHVLWPNQGPVLAPWLMQHFGTETIAVAALTGAWAGWLGWKAGYRVVKPGVRESGYELLEFDEARGLLNDELRVQGEGLWLTKRLLGGAERLMKSIFILGTPGGGKTVAITHLLKQMWGAGWKTLVIDGPKCDFTPITPDAIVIGPTYNGYALDIARDVPDRGAAIEFAAGLIHKDEAQPIWGSGARMSLVTIICALQDAKGVNWGWGDLKEMLFLTISEVKKLAEEHYPPAVPILDEESKTTQSIFVNYSTELSLLWEICVAWENTTKKFSIREWFLNDQAAQKNVILRVDGRYAEITGALSSAVFRLISGLLTSELFVDAKYRKNPTRTAIVIDELGQLQKLPGLEKFMEAGRSKWVMAALATQVAEQVEKKYGKPDMAAWFSMVGTKIFVQTTGEGVEFAAKMVGRAAYWLPTETISVGPTGGVSRSVSYHKDERPVVDAMRLGELGKRKDELGVDVLVLLPQPVIDYIPFVLTPQLREGSNPNPDFGRSVSKMARSDSGTDIQAAPAADLQTAATENSDSTESGVAGQTFEPRPEPDSVNSQISEPSFVQPDFLIGQTDDGATGQTFEPRPEPDSDESPFDDVIEHAATDQAVEVVEHLAGVGGLGLALELAEAVGQVSGSEQKADRAGNARQVAAARRAESAQKVAAARKALIDQGRPATRKTIAELAGVSEKTVRRLMSEAEE